MPVTDPMHGEAAATGSAAGSNLALIGSGAVLTATLLVSVWTLPVQLVLPAVCIAALAAACVVGLVAWRSRAANRRHPTYWDIAGALTFVGMCAAVLSEPDQVLPLLQVAASDN
jgi:uncharacterized membrane protein YfcA